MWVCLSHFLGLLCLCIEFPSHDFLLFLLGICPASRSWEMTDCQSLKLSNISKPQLAVILPECAQPRGWLWVNTSLPFLPVPCILGLTGVPARVWLEVTAFSLDFPWRRDSWNYNSRQESISSVFRKAYKGQLSHLWFIIISGNDCWHTAAHWCLWSSWALQARPWSPQAQGLEGRISMARHWATEMRHSS